MGDEFDDLTFWQDRVQDEEYIDLFDDDELTSDSVISYGCIVDCNSTGISEWLKFPDVYAFLGFLNYIFVPTSLMNFFADECGGYIVAELHDLPYLLHEYNSMLDQDKEMMPNIEFWEDAMRHLWRIRDRNTCVAQTKELLKALNKQWNKKLNKFSSIEMFGSPREVGDFVVSYYTSGEVTLDDMKHDLKVTKNEWLTVCDNALNNSFIKRQFIEMLNNKLPEIF